MKVIKDDQTRKARPYGKDLATKRSNPEPYGSLSCILISNSNSNNFRKHQNRREHHDLARIASTVRSIKLTLNAKHSFPQNYMHDADGNISNPFAPGK